MVGDYDWWRLADVLRFRRDEAAGMIEADPDSLIVHGFDVMTGLGFRAFIDECARRETERTGATDWTAREAALMEEVARILAARDVGKALRPLPQDATAAEMRWWREAHDRAYAAALANLPEGRAA